MYKKSITHYISKITVDILFYLSILCTASTPFVGENIFNFIGYGVESYKIPFVITIFLSGLCCVYILYNLKQLYRSLLVGNPFVDKNVGYLRKMAVACMCVSIIYLLKCFIVFTIATVVIAVVFIIGCLFCLTLKDLFKQAINYKTENELTI